MLLKLFKYDFKSSARFGIPVLIAIAAATILGCINAALTVGGADGAGEMLEQSAGPISEFLIFASMGGLVLIAFALAAAASVMSILLLVQYYRSTVSDEGYLTFTLPVTPAQILWSKLLNVTVWSAFTGMALVIAASCIIGTGVLTAGVGEDFANTFAELFSFIGSYIGQSGLTVVLLCLLGAASFVSNYLMLFMAITFGSVIVRKHKALAAVTMIFGINFVMNGITSILQIILLGDFTFKAALYDGLASVNIFLVSSTILYAALATVYFLITKYMMEKKLNLD